MSATPIEAARIAGALKCMDALRQLEQSAENPNQDDTFEAYFAQRLADTSALVAALGPMAPEHEGAIATLAEYIHSGICGCTPDISPGYWLPLAALTDAERMEVIDCGEAERAEIDAQYNVISLAERRAAP
jgi:hypothetical protein